MLVVYVLFINTTILVLFNNFTKFDASKNLSLTTPKLSLNLFE